jgi:hypothetical protein
MTNSATLLCTVGTAAECAEHETVVSVLETDGEDGSDLSLGLVGKLWRQQEPNELPLLATAALVRPSILLSEDLEVC